MKTDNSFATDAKTSAKKTGLLARLGSLVRDPVGALSWRYARMRDRIDQERSIRNEDKALQRRHKEIDREELDPRVAYPSYKSFDEFIDVKRLRALDNYLNERIQKHIRTRDDEKFHTGDLTIDAKAAKVPGSRIIYLSKSKHEFNYWDLNVANLWEPAEDATEFSLLMDFIRTLPFKETARMMIMYDGSGNPVTAHRDHYRPNLLHEFVWFRTSLSKPFYVLDPRTGERRYVESYTAWFDTCNQFHGADAKPGLSVSIRVDGTFTDEFRARIPVPSCNLASTPSLWASIGDKT
ncbi:MAG TPA: hypothetical protein VGH50_10100 [Candidatus Binatia bacterium]|jgi:hypothetical protein